MRVNLVTHPIEEVRSERVNLVKGVIKWQSSTCIVTKGVDTGSRIKPEKHQEGFLTVVGCKMELLNLKNNRNL